MMCLGVKNFLGILGDFDLFCNLCEAESLILSSVRTFRAALVYGVRIPAFSVSDKLSAMV